MSRGMEDFFWGSIYNRGISGPKIFCTTSPYPCYFWLGLRNVGPVDRSKKMIRGILTSSCKDFWWAGGPAVKEKCPSLAFFNRFPNWPPWAGRRHVPAYRVFGWIRPWIQYRAREIRNISLHQVFSYIRYCRFLLFLIC
jgi:hypothetical protein